MENTLVTTEHIELVGVVLIPLGLGIGRLIWQQAQMATKVNLMWTWYTNHGSDITGYKEGDEIELKMKSKRRQ